MHLLVAIQLLEPQLSKSEIDSVLEILLGNKPLLPHGRLPKANFKAPVIQRDSNPRLFSALVRVVEALAAKCERRGFAALASTQVGLRYPLCVFDFTHKGYPFFMTHPSVFSISRSDAIRLEGCGSLCDPKGLSYLYLVKYPHTCQLSYFSPVNGEKKFHKSLQIPSLVIPPRQIDGFPEGADVLHEVRHLWGQSAASGFLVSPKSLTSSQLRQLENSLESFIGREYFLGIETLLQGHKYQPGLRFRAYLRHAHRLGDISGFLEPVSGHVFHNMYRVLIPEIV